MKSPRVFMYPIGTETKTGRTVYARYDNALFVEKEGSYVPRPPPAPVRIV